MFAFADTSWYYKPNDLAYYSPSSFVTCLFSKSILFPTNEIMMFAGAFSLSSFTLVIPVKN